MNNEPNTKVTNLPFKEYLTEKDKLLRRARDADRKAIDVREQSRIQNRYSKRKTDHE